MKQIITQIAFTLLFIVVAKSYFADSIKCYVCQSNVDPKCADPFDNLTLPITDCDAYPRADLVPKSESDVLEDRGFFSSFTLPTPVKPLRATMCRKIRQKVNGEWRTIRGCGYLGPPGDQPPDKQDYQTGSSCQMRYGAYDVFMETCACNNKDGCNSSTSLSVLETNFLIVFMLIIYYKLSRN